MAAGNRRRDAGRVLALNLVLMRRVVDRSVMGIPFALALAPFSFNPQPEARTCIVPDLTNSSCVLASGCGLNDVSCGTLMVRDYRILHDHADTLFAGRLSTNTLTWFELRVWPETAFLLQCICEPFFGRAKLLLSHVLTR